MAISERLKAFLTTSRVTYAVTKHPVVYTAQEIAAAQHVSGRKLAKCVLITTDRGATLAVLPAIHLIDVRKLKILLGASKVSIAKEADIKERFPDVEVGAMSPFGNLYNVPVVAEKSLGDSEDIVFNAGSHTETIAMRHRDFVSLVKPKIGTFGQAIGGPAKGRKAGAKRSVRRGSGRRLKAEAAQPRRLPHPVPDQPQSGVASSSAPLRIGRTRLSGDCAFVRTEVSRRVDPEHVR